MDHFCHDSNTVTGPLHFYPTPHTQSYPSFGGKKKNRNKKIKGCINKINI